MSLYFLLTVFALVLHSTSAQGTCSELQISAYILGLPNGAACAAAGQALTDEPPTDPNLMTFCNANCGRPLTEYQLLNCSDDTALLSALSCIPTGDTSSLGAYCRYSFPDQPALAGILAGLAACGTFSGGECPIGCADALMAAQAAVGCCYQNLYNDVIVLRSFAQFGILSQENITFLLNIGNDMLWQACDLTMPAACSDEYFPRTSGQTFGVCSQSQFESFESEQLSESCRTNLMHSLDNIMLDDLDFDVLCTTDCGGKVADYMRNTCKSEYQAALTGITCLDAGNASLGDRCRYAFSDRVTPLFVNVGSTCIDDTPETCGLGCADTLRAVESQIGCCYQTFYNSTFLGYGLFLFFDNFTTDSVAFFEVLNNPVLWDACDVPLIEECQGEPLTNVATTSVMTSTTDDGAIKPAASLIVLIFIQLVAILYLIS